MYSLIRPFLFRMEPEAAHRVALFALHHIPEFLFRKPKRPKPVSAMGLHFPHAVGLAAGLDKNAEHLDALSKLGFSFIEVGTVTKRPQEGNSQPRLFRIPEALALINRMGFNNKGVDILVANIQKANYKGILGINIGKNKDTPLERAEEDYTYCLNKVYEHASYVSINISSPNTPDLRQLQRKGPLDVLLKALSEEQKRLADKHQRWVPLVIKISPDEKDETLKELAAAVLKHGLAGIIATNTTASREAVRTLPFGQETGGLSGKPLALCATHCIKILKKEVGDSVTLIGVGGIHDVQSAKQKMAAGATLLQVYTGLIYKGSALIPTLVENI